MDFRIARGFLVGIAALLSVAANAQAVQVSVDGAPISFPDAQPQMVNGRVLVPLRGVFEAIGATVLWDAPTQSIAASQGNRRVRLKIGDLEANVNGRVVEMDTAPEITQGSTLVPLRFLSQSLGASVDWLPDQNLVAIKTHHEHDHDGAPPVPPQIQQQTIVVQTPPPPPQDPEPRFVIPAYTVIPLRMDQTISSNGNENGDKFTLTVRADSDGYLDLPPGTKVIGIVRHAEPARGNRPGKLELRFPKLLLPNGRQYTIWGSVVSLNDGNVYRTPDGRFIARQNDDVRNVIQQDAAIGAGAGLVFGSLHAKAVGGAVAGGILGAAIGAFTSQHADNNVRIDRGTRLGLILGKEFVMYRRELR